TARSRLRPARALCRRARLPPFGGGASFVVVPSLRRLSWCLCLAPLAAACGGPFPQSTFANRSELAGAQSALYTHILWFAVVVFIVVEGMLVFVLLPYRHRDGAPRPPQTHGHTVLEITWTLAPALILMLIAVPTVRTIFATAADAPAGALR